MASTQTPPETAAIPDEPQVEAELPEPKEEDAEPSTVETPATEATAPDDKDKALDEIKAKWPGWPGYSVFRLLVPVLKVGGIIGRKGDLIKKLVEETRARVRVLDGPITSPDRIVLISGKEEPEAALSPAMDAIIRIFKRVNGLPENDGDNTNGAAFCSIRLLVAATQAISLIGKQGSLIKSIQETTGASVRVLSNDEVPSYANSQERVVELQGEALKVLKALEAVVGHLRKFLVDQSVLPLFEKSNNAPAAQERPVDPWSDKTSLHQTTPQVSLGVDYPVTLKRESLFLDRENQMESHIPSSRLSLYAQELGLANRSSLMGRSGGPVVTQIAQTMQIPLAYAEDIIGVQGTNIDYIRRSSGAILSVEESRGLPEEITVEIKGTSSQVHAAQQLIQEFISGHREPAPGSYQKLESAYSRLGGGGAGAGAGAGGSSYLPPSYAGGQPFGGYGSSGPGPGAGAGGYSSFRL